MPLGHVPARPGRPFRTDRASGQFIAVFYQDVASGTISLLACPQQWDQASGGWDEAGSQRTWDYCATETWQGGRPVKSPGFLRRTGPGFEAYGKDRASGAFDAGSTTFTDSASGTITLSGTSVEISTRTDTGSGTIVFDGTSVEAFSVPSPPFVEDVPLSRGPGVVEFHVDRASGLTIFNDTDSCGTWDQQSGTWNTDPNRQWNACNSFIVFSGTSVENYNPPPPIPPPDVGRKHGLRVVQFRTDRASGLQIYDDVVPKFGPPASRIIITGTSVESWAVGSPAPSHNLPRGPFLFNFRTDHPVAAPQTVVGNDSNNGRIRLGETASTVVTQWNEQTGSWDAQGAKVWDGVALSPRLVVEAYGHAGTGTGTITFSGTSVEFHAVGVNSDFASGTITLIGPVLLERFKDPHTHSTVPTFRR